MYKITHAKLLNHGTHKRILLEQQKRMQNFISGSSQNNQNERNSEKDAACGSAGYQTAVILRSTAVVQCV